MTEKKGNKPTHRAYVVTDGKGDRSNWSEVGAAFIHKDGKGYDLILKAVPLDGRVVLRMNEAKPKKTDD